MISTIEKGEQRIEKNAHMCAALAAKVESYKDPWTQLEIMYSTKNYKQFSEDADRFLVRFSCHARQQHEVARGLVGLARHLMLCRFA